MQRLTLIVLFILTTSGCAGLDVAKGLAKSALGAKAGVEVDANAGQAKTEGDDSVAQNANTAVSVAGGNTEENFEGPVGQVINESGLKPYELLLLVLLAGWAIPSPTEMLVGIARTGRQFWLTITGKLPS